MGNRAVITTRQNFDNNGVGVYLHWNGGRDSVEAFLAYCKLKGYRAPSYDNYGWARLCQVIGNYFGGSTSLGIDVVSRLDCNNGDNGTYIIHGWDIVGREHFGGWEQDEYKLEDMLLQIDSCMPVEEQLGKSFFESKIVETSDLKIGDKVYVQNFGDDYELFQVVGFGEAGNWVNGHDVTGIPYVNRYGQEHYCGEITYDHNINNYLLEPEYRVAQD